MRIAIMGTGGAGGYFGGLLAKSSDGPLPLYGALLPQEERARRMPPS